MPRVPHKK